MENQNSISSNLTCYFVQAVGLATLYAIYRCVMRCITVDGIRTHAESREGKEITFPGGLRVELLKPPLEADAAIHLAPSSAKENLGARFGKSPWQMGRVKTWSSTVTVRSLSNSGHLLLLNQNRAVLVDFTFSLIAYHWAPGTKVALVESGERVLIYNTRGSKACAILGTLVEASSKLYFQKNHPLPLTVTSADDLILTLSNGAKLEVAEKVEQGSVLAAPFVRLWGSDLELHFNTLLSNPIRGRLLAMPEKLAKITAVVADGKFIFLNDSSALSIRGLGAPSRAWQDGDEIFVLHGQAMEGMGVELSSMNGLSALLRSLSYDQITHFTGRRKDCSRQFAIAWNKTRGSRAVCQLARESTVQLVEELRNMAHRKGAREARRLMQRGRERRAPRPAASLGAVRASPSSGAGDHPGS